MEWRDGWPVIGDAGRIELEQPVPGSLPGAGRSRVWPHERTAWTRGWTSVRGPLQGGTASDDGRAWRLPYRPAVEAGAGTPGVVVRPQQEPAATLRATLERTPSHPCAAGVIVYGNATHQFSVSGADGARGEVGAASARLLCAEVAGGFIGSHLGLVATGPAAAGAAEFRDVSLG